MIYTKLDPFLPPLTFCSTGFLRLFSSSPKLEGAHCPLQEPRPWFCNVCCNVRFQEQIVPRSIWLRYSRWRSRKKMGLKSEWVCVVTQGWVSHKMLPLAGKRGVVIVRHSMPSVWCGVAEVWCSMVDVWYGRGVVRHVRGVVMWCGTWWGMECHIKCCHCQVNILPFLVLLGHNRVFAIRCSMVLHDIVLAILWSWSMNGVVLYGLVCYHISSYPMVWYCKVEYGTAWCEWYYMVLAWWLGKTW